MSAIYSREARRLRETERKIAEEFNASVFTSDAEIDLFARLAPESREKTHCIRNGVDLDYFDPARTYANPFPKKITPIVFVGLMNYWPNGDAVDWFARNALPRIRAEQPNAEFWIVGAHPNRAVLSLAELPGVRVTGAVRDVRPYLAHASLAVAPMRLARGLQNKVLEALAMDKAVLLTPAAQLGLGAHGDHPSLTVAEARAPDFADAALRLLDSRDDRQQNSRLFVETHFRWEPAYADLSRLLESDHARGA